MKWHRKTRSSSEADGGHSNPPNDPSSPAPKRHRFLKWLGIVVLTLAVLLGIARALLPKFVRDYVNRTLDRNIAYEGKIGDVEIHLWRGAYSIHDVQISKRTGEVPVPFFAAKRLDFSIQWNALRHGRVVGRFEMDQPELNFVSNPSDEDSQTGAGGPWMQMIRDLFPFKINRAEIRDGSVHFRTYQSEKPVDIYLSHVDGSIDNLGNIRDETTPLVTKIEAKGLAMDQAKIDLKMSLDPFSYHPTFHLAVRLLGLDVTKLNDLATTYGKFNFKQGWFDLVIEADDKEGQLTGYVKPLFRNLKVFIPKQDLAEDNVLQFFWQALVGGVTTALKNFHRDQFGTLIPFTGDTSGATTTDILATIGNILRNAFVRAYLPRLEPERSPEGNLLQFEAPDFAESISTDSERQ